jgi:hypothetical protein
LFLSRSGFYDKPNKKGVTRVQNPKLNQIVDLTLNEYLKVCTKSTFNSRDYETFCDYLSQESFEDELLGNRIGSLLEKQILVGIKQDKYDKYQFQNMAEI